MDKLERLEAKVNELEAKVNKLEKIIEINNIDKAIEESFEYLNDKGLYEIIISYRGTYQRYFEEMYSVDRFREEGFSTDLYKFDFKNLLKQSKKCNTRLERLHFWTERKKDLDGYIFSQGKRNYWNHLLTFIRYAVEYYRTSLLAYILDHEKHMDKGGRKPDIDRDYVIELWEAYRTEPELIHESGRYKGEPMKEDIYGLIADKIGISRHQNDRFKRIQQIIKEYESEGK